MKKILHLLLTAQLTELLQQLSGKYSAAPTQHTLQPLPAYWQMKPVSKVIHTNRNRN